MKKKLTPAQVSAMIKRNNATFRKLTKVKKRVAIAKDVIKQIDAKLLIPEAATYFTPKDHSMFYDYANEELSPFFYTEKCNACAIGSLFISQIRKEDNFKLDKDCDIDDERDMRVKLRKYFTPLQLSMIETAYMQNIYFAEKVNLKKYSLIITRCKKYRKKNKLKEFTTPNDSKALKLIMQNLIDNKGTFKP